MPKPEPPDSSYEVQIKHQYHAFLVANVSIHDIGQGRKLEIGLDGLKYTATASQEAIRVAPNLTGLWRATFYIRTKSNAKLESHFKLRRLRALTSSTNQQTAFWTCTGKVHRIDLEHGLLEIAIHPNSNRQSQFTLTVQVSPEQVDLLGHSPFVHATGTINNHHLMVSILEPRSWVDQPQKQHQLVTPIEDTEGISHD